MALNCVLTTTGMEIVPLPNETTFWRKNGIRFELDCSNGGYPGAGVFYNSRRGTLYLTNQRVIYLCAEPTSFFSSASLPLNNVQDGQLTQPWFSSPSYKAVVTPVPGGGLVQPGALSMTFTEGGSHEFEAQYKSLKERLHELDGAAPQHLEPLPVYQPPPPTEAATPSAAVEALIPTLTSPTAPVPESTPQAVEEGESATEQTASPASPAVPPPATAGIPEIEEGDQPPAYDA